MLEQVAEKLGAPIIKAQLGKDCVPDDSPYTTGPIALVGSRPSEEALEQCDGLLVVGSSLPYMEYLPQPGQATCVQVDDKPERIGLRCPVDVALCGDAGATLTELLPLLEHNEDRSFLEQAQQGMRDWWALMEERGTRQDMPMKPQVPAWARRLADHATGRHVTRVQHHQPVIIAVVSNDTLGLIKWEQMVFLGNPEYGVNMAPLDFVKFADACGASGARVSEPGQCVQTLREAFAHDGPAIIEMVVDPHEPPMPAKVKKDQVTKLFSALKAGAPNRIAMQMGQGRAGRVEL